MKLASVASLSLCVCVCVCVVHSLNSILPPPHLSTPVDDQLYEGTNLLSDLHAYQWNRLAQSPSLDSEGHTILPPPSQQEKETG